MKNNRAEILELLENPGTVSIGKRPPRSSSWPSLREKIDPGEALYEIADRRICLNGLFSYEKFNDLPENDSGFYLESFDDSCWNELHLPSNFEFSEAHFTPIYRNNGWTFRVDPPRVSAPAPESYTAATEANPTLRCRRFFELPEDFLSSERHVFLYFGGVQSAFRVWINGSFMMFSQNSFSPAECEIGAYLHPGRNLIALEVYKYSSGSYLEDQDAWRLCGVFRDIFLYHCERIYLDDIQIDASAASRRVTASVRTGGLTEGEPFALELRCGSTLRTRVENAPSLSLDVPFAEPWTAETPRLYPLSVLLYDAQGRCRDIRHFRAGFRDTAIRDAVFLLNGVPLKLHGVNRHEFDPLRGRVMSRERMFQDLMLMKRCNFDAVRSSHYPNHPLWYELCDRYGLYVLDEANLESHGLSYHKCVLPGDDPAWTPAVLDRIRSAVIVNRNHASIVIWSLGNEAGYGTVFEQAAAWIHLHDCRPIQYADMNAPCDFDSQTYPPPSWLEDYIRGVAVRKGEQGQHSALRQHGIQPSEKPFLMNEYAHAMGNSGGNFQEYWTTIEAHARLSGGFLWEFCEHGILKKNAHGDSFFAYGGDFGDFPNNGNFCCDGLFRADRQPNPQVHEIRYVQSAFRADLDCGDGTPESFRIRLRNKAAFTAFRSFSWTLCRNGIRVLSGSFDETLPPGAETFVATARLFPLQRDRAENEYFLRLEAFRPDGRSAGEEEIAVSFNENDPAARPVLLAASGSFFSSSLSAEMRKEYGVHSVFPAANIFWKKTPPDAFSAFTLKDCRNSFFFAESASLILTRPETDNDRGAGWAGRNAWFYSRAAEKALSLRWSIVSEKEIYARIACDLPDFSEFPPEERPEFIPRFGLRLTLPKKFCASLKWYGRGPWENYCDRKRSAFVGIYSALPEELTTPYSRPQENACRSDLRYLILCAEDGSQIKITSPLLFSFTLRPYSSEALAAAEHPYDLKNAKVSEYELILDYAQSGVGGNDSWGQLPDWRYRLPPLSCRTLFHFESL